MGNRIDLLKRDIGLLNSYNSGGMGLILNFLCLGWLSRCLIQIDIAQ